MRVRFKCLPFVPPGVDASKAEPCWVEEELENADKIPWAQRADNNVELLAKDENEANALVSAKLASRASQKLLIDKKDIKAAVAVLKAPAPVLVDVKPSSDKVG